MQDLMEGKGNKSGHYIVKYIYMVAPPPRAYLGRVGMYRLPSVVLNTFKDMLRKHCKISVFYAHPIGFVLTIFIL